MKTYVYFDEKEYRVGYSRDKNGAEAIVIAEKPYNPNEGWLKAQISHTYYYDNRLELGRLPKIINDIFEENERFCREECFDDSGWSAPSAEDIRVSSSEYGVYLRDYSSTPIGHYWGSNSVSVDVSESDLIRTIDLIKHGLIKLDSKVVGNYEAFSELDPDNPDCRLVALTLATLQIGEAPQDFSMFTT